MTLWHLGDPDRALALGLEALQRAREIGHPFSLAYCLHHLSWLYSFLRMGAEVQKTAEEQVAISTEQDFALWRATGTFFQGVGLFLLGRHEEAIPLLLKGHRDFRSTGAEIFCPFQLGFLGEAYTRASRFDEAREALNEALMLVEKNDDRIQEAELHRLHGELLLAESPESATDAESHFRRAVEIARQQRSRGWELRAAISLARLHQRQGRDAEARELLTVIRAAYPETPTTPDLAEADALRTALA